MTRDEEYVYLTEQLRLARARLDEIENEEAFEAVREMPVPYVSAMDLPLARERQRTALPIMPPPPLRPVVRNRAPREPIPVRLTAADFPRAPNAQTPPVAGVGTQAMAEHVRTVTTADSVRDGTYAKHREQLMRMVGPQAQSQHAFAPSGLVALNPQQLAPVSSHPLFGGSQRAPQGAIVQPHGNPMTGPPSELLLAKRDRARAARGRGK
jgi:hypothetical protein